MSFHINYLRFDSVTVECPDEDNEKLMKFIRKHSREDEAASVIGCDPCYFSIEDEELEINQEIPEPIQEAMKRLGGLHWESLQPIQTGDHHD